LERHHYTSPPAAHDCLFAGKAIAGMIEQWVIEHKRRKVRFCVVIVESSIGFVCNFLYLHAIVSPGKPRLLLLLKKKEEKEEEKDKDKDAHGRSKKIAGTHNNSFPPILLWRFVSNFHGSHVFWVEIFSAISGIMCIVVKILSLFAIFREIWEIKACFFCPK
jgi:hypothetical protein